MKKIIATPAGLYFDLDRLSAAKIADDNRVLIWLEGSDCYQVAAQYADKAEAKQFFKNLLAEWSSEK